MATHSSDGTNSGGDLPDPEVTDFLSLLNELKATGCTLLVVGDASPKLFTRASTSLLGDSQTVRYRLLAVTDAGPQSIAERFPSPANSPRPLSETAHVVNHAATPRSVASTTRSGAPEAITQIPKTRVADSRLEGLESALVENVGAFADCKAELRPGELRVGIDSVGTLLDYHEEGVVRRCLQMVGDCVRDRNGMAHYVLQDSLESERVQSLAADVDAIIEIRSVNPDAHGHDAQQRWHVPDRDLTIDWLRL